MAIRRLSVQEYIDGILAGDRVVLSRAITLVESRLEADRLAANQVLHAILPHTGRAKRIGITGVPGVGKSTFIESFGSYITQQKGLKLAVLAIDPSSQRTKGSIMGDKTRMESLSHDPKAYIRPSPSGDSLGGITRKTRETMLLCEAAGFDIILIETVGVGQSETAVRSMTDFFLLLMLAGAGDNLQGMKRGIMEMADALTITKADGSNVQKALNAKIEYENAIHLFPLPPSGWATPVSTCSSMTQEGIPELWQLTEKYFDFATQKGWLQKQRQEQNKEWLHETIKQTLLDRFYENPTIKQALAVCENAVENGQQDAVSAAYELLNKF
ncbi:methylmalonyl Co-A mutase-associated GTPase MeaB [Flexibacter flexilis]|nr:methylmalonyl Co-A mutase-associated GTPase MeaB [Flexibacter flexilis]